MEIFLYIPHWLVDDYRTQGWECSYYKPYSESNFSYIARYEFDDIGERTGCE